MGSDRSPAAANEIAFVSVDDASQDGRRVVALLQRNADGRIMVRLNWLSGWLHGDKFARDDDRPRRLFPAICHISLQRERPLKYEKSDATDPHASPIPS